MIGVWIIGGWIVGVIAQAIWGPCDLTGCGMNSNDIHVMVTVYVIWYGVPPSVFIAMLIGWGCWELVRCCLPPCPVCEEKGRHVEGCYQPLAGEERSLAMERAVGLEFDGIFLLPGYSEFEAGAKRG